VAAGCWLVCSDTSACVEAGNNDCNNKTTSIMVGRSDDRSLEQKKASSKTFLTTARSAQVAATSRVNSVHESVVYFRSYLHSNAHVKKTYIISSFLNACNTSRQTSSTIDKKTLLTEVDSQD
jgi:hypothetical protein